MIKKVKVVELFGGIGAPRKALERLGYSVDSLYIEIDKHATRSYNALYNENNEPTSIIGYDFTKFKGQFDMLIAGWPCQDISVAGKMMGMSEGSDTRSSLIWQTVRAIEEIEPNYIVLENVAQATSKRFKPDLDKIVNRLENLGYNIKMQVLNATDFGVPQTRKRLIIVGIKKGIDSNFDFNNLRKTKTKPLTDYIDFEDFENENRYEFKGEQAKKHLKDLQTRDIYDTVIFNPDGSPNFSKRFYTKEQHIGTITARRNFALYNKDKNKFMSLTSLEHWLLMGFNETDHFKCISRGVSNNQLYKQAGNSIVVDMLESVFEELLKGDNNEPRE